MTKEEIKKLIENVLENNALEINENNYKYIIQLVLIKSSMKANPKTTKDVVLEFLNQKKEV